MSSISSIGGNATASAFQTGHEQSKHFEKDLTKYLQSRGVSSEEQADITKEIQDSVQSNPRI